jgi:exonuclease SbcD
VPKSFCSILHTSDIHLDNDIGCDGEESNAQLGLISVIDRAIDLDVQLFLIAGDLFDHNRVKQPCLDFATEQMSRLHCPVVMIAGNHDCLTDYSIYHAYDPTDAGSHIHFIKSEFGDSVEFDELGVRIWGRSIVDHAPENKPLEIVPEHDFDGWNIGMAHGYYINRGGTSFSSLITPEEIAASCFDYLALGHVHVFSEIEHGNTLAAYSGSPNLTHSGQEKTAAHIVLDPANGVQLNRLVLQ